MRQSTKKRLIITLAVLVVLGLAFPVSNLIITPSTAVGFPADVTGEPLAAKVAGTLERKCAFCHVSGAAMPFYAGLPVAKGMIGEDVREGLAFLDLPADLFPDGKGPAAEVGLAKLEYAAEKGTMPPGRFLLLHWNGGLGAAEREEILTWARKVRREQYATEGVAPEFLDGVVQPLPEPEGLDPKKVAVGEKLFHDKRLSKDDTIACASCHDLAKGGTDQARFSTGVDGAMGDINAPTVLNSGFQFKQFWDGRAATLEEQAAGPVTNPVEMAATWEQVLGKLEKDAAFMEAFGAAYPEGLSQETITAAIATFERTLVTTGSRFDEYLGGNEDTITAEEKKGFETFLDIGCATCHAGKLLGGQSFERMGIEGDYFADRGEVGKPDMGRFNVTQKERDRHRLKVPTLRDVVLTRPYFHDGSTEDLSAAVRTMARYQLGVELPDTEAAGIVSFLNTLTGQPKVPR